MKSSSIVKLMLLSAVALTSLGARAEDIDIYAGVQPNAAKPNLLMILDNSSAWNANQAFTCASPANAIVGANNVGANVGVEQCGLYNAVAAIGNSTALLGNINLGLMYLPASGGSKPSPAFANAGGGGQFVAPSYKPAPGALITMDATGISTMKSKIAALDRQADNSSNNQVSQAMQEAWAFYQGKTGLSGISYSGLGSSEEACAGNKFVVYIALATNNAKPQDQGNIGLNALTTAEAAGGTTQLNLTSWSGASGKYKSDAMDEWANFMYTGKTTNPSKIYPRIITYSIILTDGSNPDYEQLMISAAKRGGGKYFLVAMGDTSGLTQALLQIFNEVQAVNSVFASPGLPVSANLQGVYLNQIFIATFRPDASSNPRWRGNLKQYQFGVDTTDPKSASVFLADASWGPYQTNKTANPALSSAGTGFISPNAISFWTSKDTSKLPDSVGGFWLNDPQGISLGFDSADGEFVEKGGVSQQLRLASLTNDYAANPTTPRNLYTCIGCSAGTALGATTATKFATTNTGITGTLLGISGSTALSVSSMSRSGTTATVVLATAPNPALTVGQSVTIAGSSYAELNGTFAIATVPNSTTFAYPISESPPATSAGTYAATVPSSPKTLSSLTRSGTTATASFTGDHGYVNGASVTITGATQAEYNGTYTITSVPTTTSFTYTITDSPVAATTGGTATVGSQSTTFTSANITRAATAADRTSIVTVVTGSNLNSVFVAGATVTVSGVTPSAYNVTTTLLYGGGNSAGGSCPGSPNAKKSFCYKITTTPASPATGTIQSDMAASVGIAAGGLTHPLSCTGGSPSPNVTVTATTSSNHPFVSGQTVNIGGTVGANESSYVGSFTVTKLSNTQFTFPMTVNPPCAPSGTGVTATVTSNSGVSKDTLIQWVRGSDNFGDEPSPGNGITVRPSIHGDVLHSRPAVINYGGSTGVVVFYGANDGVFRAVNGNQPNNADDTTKPQGFCTASTSCNIGSTPPGGELWGFIAPEFFPKLKRLYENSPGLKLASTPEGIEPTPAPKDYFFDGSTSVYQNGSTAYLFLSARRGGRLIYALDVSDPSAPRFMWKKGCPNMTDNVGCSSGFNELGQTWSLPKAARVRGYSNPVLIFGAGYDTVEDKPAPTTAGMGRGIFIVDAVDGSIVWRSGPGTTSNTCVGTPCQVKDMIYPIPADVTLVDRVGFDGYIDRLYAADIGGNLWRVDLEPTAGNAPANWQLTKFAALGGPASASPKRKFFFPPDVVLTKNFDAVLIGSGDREKPLMSQTQAYDVVNRFYMIKDTNVGVDASSWTPIIDDSDPTTADAPSTSPAQLFNATTTPYTGSPAGGFYLTLDQNPQNASSGSSKQGEKVVNAATTIGGYTYFGTNQPKPADAGSCAANLGNARGYKISFIDGSGTGTPTTLCPSGNCNIFDGGGLPPSPVSGLVTVKVNGKEGQLPFLIGGGGSSGSADDRSGLGGGKPEISNTTKRKRTYWNREIDR